LNEDRKLGEEIRRDRRKKKYDSSGPRTQTRKITQTTKQVFLVIKEKRTENGESYSKGSNGMKTNGRPTMLETLPNKKGQAEETRQKEEENQFLQKKRKTASVGGHAWGKGKTRLIVRGFA